VRQYEGKSGKSALRSGLRHAHARGGAVSSSGRGAGCAQSRGAAAVLGNGACIFDGLEDEPGDKEGEAGEEVEGDEGDERLGVRLEAEGDERREEHGVERIEEQQGEAREEALGRAREVGLEQQHERHPRHDARVHETIPQPRRPPVREDARTAHELDLLGAARTLAHERRHRRGGRVREGREDDDRGEQSTNATCQDRSDLGLVGGQRQVLRGGRNRGAPARERLHARIVRRCEEGGQRVDGRGVEDEGCLHAGRMEGTACVVVLVREQQVVDAQQRLHKCIGTALRRHLACKRSERAARSWRGGSEPRRERQQRA
jgi:hypothetical protein